MKKFLKQSLCKDIFYIGSVVFAFNIASNTLYADNNNDDEESKYPIIAAKISKSTVDKATSPDGFKGIAGLIVGSQKFESTISGGKSTTAQTIGTFAVTAGIEYAKVFKSRLFLAIQGLIDLWPKKKKESDWAEFNADLNSAVAGANKHAQLYTEAFVPSIGFKLGYWFREQKCTAYAKLGISRIAGKYKYYLGDQKFATVGVSSISPNIVLGGEYRINRKLGAGLEIGFPMRKTFSKKNIANGIEHKTKISRFEVRVLGTYTISKPKSLPGSLNDLK